VDAHATVTDPQQAPAKYQIARPEDVEVEDAPDVHPKPPVAVWNLCGRFEYQMPMPIAAPLPDPKGARRGLVARRLRWRGYRGNPVMTREEQLAGYARRLIDLEKALVRCFGMRPWSMGTASENSGETTISQRAKEQWQ